MTACVSSRSSVSSSPRVTRMVESSKLRPVMAAFVSGRVDEQHTRRLHACGDGHLLDEIAELLFFQVARLERSGADAIERPADADSSHEPAHRDPHCEHRDGAGDDEDGDTDARPAAMSRCALPASIASTARGIASESVWSDVHVAGESGEMALMMYATSSANA